VQAAEEGLCLQSTVHQKKTSENIIIIILPLQQQPQLAMIDDIKMSTTDHHHPSNSTSKLEQGAFDIFDFTTKTAGSNATGGGASGIGMDGGVENVNNISRNSDAFDTGQSGTDPWSDVTWGRGALLMNTSTSNTAAHAADGETVETEDVFEFSTTDNDDNIADSLLLEELLVEGDAQHQQHQQLDDDDNGEQEEASRLFFPSADDFFREVPEDPATVHVAMHEQLSAIYDDTSEDPACQVEGSIHVKPSAEMANSPFSLVLRDLMGHLKSVKDRVGGTGGTAAGDYSYSYCQDVTDKVSRQGLHKSDRVFRVTLPPNVLSNGEVPIAQYMCSSRVRPVPLVRRNAADDEEIGMVIMYIRHFFVSCSLSLILSLSLYFIVDQEPRPSFHQV
jgi:hypothetical protein